MSLRKAASTSLKHLKAALQRDPNFRSPAALPHWPAVKWASTSSNSTQHAQKPVDNSRLEDVTVLNIPRARQCTSPETRLEHVLLHSRGLWPRQVPHHPHHDQFSVWYKRCDSAHKK